MYKTIVNIEIAGLLVDGPIDPNHISELVEKLISTLQSRDVNLLSYSQKDQSSVGYAHNHPIRTGGGRIDEYNLIL